MIFEIKIEAKLITVITKIKSNCLALITWYKKENLNFFFALKTIIFSLKENYSRSETLLLKIFIHWLAKQTRLTKHNFVWAKKISYTKPKSKPILYKLKNYFTMKLGPTSEPIP